MLKRNVKVFADLRVISHLFQDILRKIGRIGIVNPYPFNSLDFRKFLNQFSKRTFPIEIQPIICGVLCYQKQFFHAFASKLGRLFHEHLDRHALVSATYERNSAI